ncbi:MAG TPA: FHA domain-containing protein, partial [Gemmatimonadaceae bacterium]|nr:FHA domain-containing protein [Gemmatimonadaceae bacterium]
SISDTHAKLQLRDDGWYVVDAGSTNGTFVGGVRITGERRLEGTPDLRFGGMRVRFHSAVAPSAAAGATRRVSVAAPEGAATSVAKGRMPVLGWILIAFVVVIAAIFFFLQRR